jgi:hypothetical protein
MKITLLNAPPRAGKDAVAMIMFESLPSIIPMKFAKRLKEAVHASLNLLGINGKPLMHNFYECVKDDTDVPGFNGVSPRQAYIQFSEGYAKPLWGDTVFGEWLADDIQLLNRNVAHHVVISDSGFESEARVLIERYGADNINLVRIMRPGCDFSRDSRSYLELPVRTSVIINDGTLEDLKRCVLESRSSVA